MVNVTVPFYSRRSRVSKLPLERLLDSSVPPPVRTMPTIAVSWGELIDKITILEIKEQRLTSPAAVENVRNELAALSRALAELKPMPAALDVLKAT